MNRFLYLLICFIVSASLHAQQEPHAETKLIFETNLAALDSAFGEHAPDTLASLAYVKNISIMATLTGINPPPDDILCWDYIEWKTVDFLKYKKQVENWYKKHRHEEPNHNVKKLIDIYRQKAQQE